MAEPLPPPLVTAGVDLRDFPYMPLDVVRLRDSSLAAQVSGEAFRCAVLLWCASWHQVPAASLPDDDALLAGYAGFGRSLREWRKHRTGSLHGWVLCADGRLYHPVVAEKANEAHKQRLKHKWRSECARLKKAAQRSRTDANYPSYEQWLARFMATGDAQWGVECPHSVPEDNMGLSPACPDEKATKGREGKGRDTKALVSNIGAHLDNPEITGTVVRALNAYGYEVNSEHPAVRRLTGIGATEGEVSEAGKAAQGMFRTKPIEWVLSRILGKRADAAEAAAGSGDQLPQVDPADAARRAAASALDDAVIECKHMVSLGAWSEERATAERAKARAAYDDAMAAVGVPS